LIVNFIITVGLSLGYEVIKIGR